MSDRMSMMGDNKPLDPAESALKEMIDSAKLMPGSYGTLTRTRDRINRYIKSTKQDYLTAVFFPEMGPSARLPTKFSTASAIFTQKDHFYADTDMLGRLGIVVLPKHVGNTNDVSKKWGQYMTDEGYVYTFTENFTEELWGKPTMTLSDEIPTYYTNVRLIGCCVRIQYIGTAMTVSGMGACSINYGYIPGFESTKQVEDTDYVQHVGTSAGLRQIWAPKDQNDWNYMNLNRDDTKYGDMSQAFMIYFSNLPPGAQKLRIDIIRHFEGIPNDNIFQYVNLAREPHSEVTLSVAAEVHEKFTFLFTLPLDKVTPVFTKMKVLLEYLDIVAKGLERNESGLYSRSGKNLLHEDNPLEVLFNEMELVYSSSSSSRFFFLFFSKSTPLLSATFLCSFTFSFFSIFPSSRAVSKSSLNFGRNALRSNPEYLVKNPSTNGSYFRCNSPERFEKFTRTAAAKSFADIISSFFIFKSFTNIPFIPRAVAISISVSAILLFSSIACCFPVILPSSNC